MKTMPGLGLAAKWDTGENGWGLPMDENLARLSAVAALSVPSLTAALTEGGGVQIAPSGDANAGEICAFVDGSWWTFQPTSGMRAHVRDRGREFVYSGTAWVPVSELHAYRVTSVTADYAISEEDFMTGATIVVTSAIDVAVTIPSLPAVTPIAAGSTLARRPVTVVQGGVGRVSVVAATGSISVSSADGLSKTRAQSSCCSVIPISESSYVLAGDLAE